MSLRDVIARSSAVLLFSAGVWAQTAAPAGGWKWNFQSTSIGQGVFAFPALYSGANSLDANGQVRETFSFDAMVDAPLWQGGHALVDVLLWQGHGLSDTEGVAAFPNGEAFRVGKTYPDAAVARAYLRQELSLGRGRLVLQIGHFAASDVFDQNRYANDGRTEFMNWGFINNLAWDYAADSLGFTNGVIAEMTAGDWSARVGAMQVSRMANGLRMDWNLPRAGSAVAEVERRYHAGSRAGSVRVLAYTQRAHMGNYQQALVLPASISAAGQQGYRSKYGFGINAEQELGSHLGGFARLGWNDGRNQTWEFTDVDRTASAGVRLDGSGWQRAGDSMGAAAIANGISAAHAQFLARGGLGITAGDGGLSYQAERVGEVYYDWKAGSQLWLTLDYQHAVNPAYNRRRGPANVLAVRAHWESH